MKLNEQQREQVAQQLQMHDRDPGLRNFILNKDTTLSLYIDKGVFGSDFMTAAIFLARYLHSHAELYKDRKVLDLGCGSGVQGIVTSMQGAREVVLSDINPRAVANAQQNVQRLGLHNIHVVEGDLFQGIPADTRFDVIIFNHPFFPEEAELFGKEFHNDLMIRKSMLGGTNLIEKFFAQVGAYLDKNGLIIMPYFDIAGKENDPAIAGPKHGYAVNKKISGALPEGIQIGGLSITILQQENSNVAY